MSCYFVHHVGTSVYDNIITYVLTGYTDLLDIMLLRFPVCNPSVLYTLLYNSLTKLS